METWAIVTLVLGTSAVSALLTFFITKMQVRHSDGRFERELERAREADSRHRRWKVRNEPLLKLRSEVAIMAAKQDKLVAFTLRYRDHARIGIPEEVAKKEAQEAYDASNKYLASGDFVQVLFTQYDTQLANKAREILVNYRNSLISAVDYTSQEPLTESLNLWERNKAKIIKVQELINKRLEEL